MDIDEVRMRLAVELSQKSNCNRRKVGCVLYNSSGNIISDGFNTTCCGNTCNINICEGINSLSGTDLDKCRAVHAEQMALIMCRTPERIHTCYVTTSPCMACMKMLMSTPCQNIIYKELYDKDALAMWHEEGRELKQIVDTYKTI